MFPGPPEWDAMDFLALVDTDRSGTVDRSEWRVFVRAGWRASPPAARAFVEYLRNLAEEKGYGSRYALLPMAAPTDEDAGVGLFGGGLFMQR